ncbi:ATG4B [Cervus elaphus hippelaphus]|uniref:Cysteine protease n=1 Tax=Cervus elaphus hippelaphus TaxID=46360 RepID=A0A212CGG3_CEREH|nr:ATG4B [Cervus elaphus hippelaphus]
MWSAPGVTSGQATLTYDTLRFAEFEDFPETSEPVWILGKKYSVLTEKDAILADVTSRLWFTYRKNFPAIGGTGPTSDTGWGCMLRCGQMIFAQALVCRHLGRGRLCRSGLPCAGAEAFPADSERHCNGFPAGAEDGGRAVPWRPLVLLIPLRLGLADVNAAYAGTLKHCFRMPQSLGVIGGKPNSAHYFIGYIGDELIYMDPHTTQPAVATADRCPVPDESFHCQHPPGRMSITELDPSIAVVRPRRPGVTAVLLLLSEGGPPLP